MAVSGRAMTVGGLTSVARRKYACCKLLDKGFRTLCCESCTKPFCKFLLVDLFLEMAARLDLLKIGKAPSLLQNLIVKHCFTNVNL